MEGLRKPRSSVSQQSRIHKVKPKLLLQQFFGLPWPLISTAQNSTAQKLDFRATGDFAGRP